MTASVDATGAIVGMTLESTGVAGVIPVTVPTSEAATVSVFYQISSSVPITVGSVEFLCFFVACCFPNIQSSVLRVCDM